MSSPCCREDASFRTAPERARIGRTHLFARIETDAGIHGIGEAGCWGALEAAQAALMKFAGYLEGRDPGPIEHHCNVLHRDAYYQGAAINGAISAIGMRPHRDGFIVDQ